MLRPSLVRLSLAAVSLLTFPFGLAGCGPSQPVAQAPKYRPAGEGAATPQDNAAAPASDPGSDAPAANPALAPAGPQTPPPSDPPAATAPGTTPGAPALGNPAPGKAPAGDLANPPKPTEKELAELVAVLHELRETPPGGKTQQEQINNFVQRQQEIVGVAGVLLESALPAKERLFAADSIMAAYQVLSQLGVNGMTGRMKSLATTLAGDQEKKLADFGKRVLFQLSVVSKMENVGGPDAQGVVTEIGKLLDETTTDRETFLVAHNACALLLKAGKQDEAVAAFKFVAEKLDKVEGPEAAEMASAARLQAQIIEFKALTAVENLYEQKPGAEEQVLTAFTALLTSKNPSPLLQQPASQAINIAFMRGKRELATKLYDLLEAAFKDRAEQEDVKPILEEVAAGRKQLALVGQPFQVEAGALDGKSIDLSSLKGKVVLVDFWATWCGPCLNEVPRLQRLYEQVKDKGFEIVGLSLDHEKPAVEQFFDRFQMSWKTYLAPEVLAGKELAGFGDLALAQQFGIQAIPFFVLVGADGKIDSVYRGGGATEAIALRLKDLLKLDAVPNLSDEPPAPVTPPAPAEQPAEKPAERPAAAPPAAPAEKPAIPVEKPAAEQPAEKPAAPPKGPQSARVGLGWGPALFAALYAPDAPENPAPAGAQPDAETNPYLAKPTLSTAQLVDFVLRMVDKPKSIQNRPGFTAAIVDACDRVLKADPPAKEIDQVIVIETRFDVLHRRASLGDNAADALLMQFTEQLAADTRPRVARQVQFFQQERKVLGAETAPAEQLPALLKELADYYAKEKLTARHLRMASATVALINRLEDGDAREAKFAEFGALFNKSSDKQLARYGKKLAKKPGGGESDLVGKPLELAGATAKGLPFAWDAYRGKVVLVDFWATWCGPCRREMPNVKALFEKHRAQGLEVVGVSLDKDLDALAAYLEENMIPWETLAGEGTDDLAEKYGVRGIPTMMLVDREGKIVAVAHNAAALIPQAEKLLAQPVK